MLTLYQLLTFLALPLRLRLGSLDFLRLTALAIPLLPSFLPSPSLSALRNLAAALLLKHLGLPSPGLLSPHFPIRSPLVL